MVEVGTRGRAEVLVTQERTARSMGSGNLPVFATPCMAALMEEAAVAALTPHLVEGQSTVGTRLEISHDAATPTGMRVWAEAEVTAAEGRRVCFRVAAFDEAGQIGAGTHERAVVDAERFLAKTQRRKEDCQNVH